MDMELAEIITETINNAAAELNLGRWDALEIWHMGMAEWIEQQTAEWVEQQAEEAVKRLHKN